MLDKTNPANQVEGLTPLYQAINPVQCVSFSSNKERIKNMKYAMSKKLNLPRLSHVPTFGGLDDLAIVAGGPTLNKTYRKIAKFKHIMSCGSAHDHILSLGIKPMLHVECDPTKSQIVNYKRKSKDIIYLLSSRCHRSMFQHLSDCPIRLWHMWETDIGKPYYNGEPAFICGATVVLSAVPIALAMGYKHFHFFGFDSSFEDKENHHAYPQPETSAMMTARVGDPNTGKEFNTTATWLGQAQQFEQMQNHWGHLFKTTVYGNSMMAEMQRFRNKQLKEQQLKEQGAAA
jgi:hypothetical protein